MLKANDRIGPNQFVRKLGGGALQQKECEFERRAELHNKIKYLHERELEVVSPQR
jgi:hypothetical protein